MKDNGIVSLAKIILISIGVPLAVVLYAALILGIEEALVLLWVLGSLFLVCVGSVMTLVAQHVHARLQQTAFQSNAAENIQAMSGVANALNSQLAKQTQYSERHMRPASANDVRNTLIIEPGALDEI